MIKKTVIALAMLTPFLLTNAHAEESKRSVEQVYKECGIGALVFGKTSPILAVISNVTWDLGTTAGISNSMSPDTCSGSSVKTAMLLKEAFPNVEQDLSSGNGEYLQALNSFMECGAVNEKVRNDFGAYTTTESYKKSSSSENAEALFDIINQNKQSAGCTV